MSKLNGHDDPKITKFPSAAEREALEKAKFVHHRDKPSGEPAINLPPVVKILCLLNISIFLIVTYLPELLTPEDVYALSFVPERYFGTEPLGFAAIFSPLSHMFIHAGWLHILMNLGMLMAFGAGLEKKMGGRRMLLFYFITGLAGALLHALVYPHMEIPMVGASGAISGLFGGILMMMYTEGMMGLGYRKLLPFIAIWIGISIFFGYFGAPGVDNPIAWTTHVGGFISGLLLYKPVLRMKV